jgi:hypothetical protein
MKLKVPVRLLAIAGLMVCGTFATAHAGVITSLNTLTLPGFSTGQIGNFGITPAPNNDDAPGVNPNVITSSYFLNAGGVGLIEFEFNTGNSGGTTEYQFVQTFINNTGQAWNGFHFELGFGTGANFVRSATIDLLDFDTPDITPQATSTFFSLVNQQSDTIDFSGNTLLPIGASAFRFRIDVADGLQNLNPSGASRFTLREYATTPPAVPEPASMLLLGTGLVGLAAKFRARKAS